MLAQATALMGPAPDEARTLLDGIVLALPTEPPDDPFSAAYREWTWDLYRTHLGPGRLRHRARGVSLRPGGRPGAAVPVPDRLAGAGRPRSGGARPPARLPDRCDPGATRGAAAASSSSVRAGATSPATWWRPGSTSPPSSSTRSSAASSRTAATAPDGSPSPRATCSASRRRSRSTPRCSSRASTTAPTTSQCCAACTTSCDPVVWCSSPSEPVQNLDYPWGPRLDGLSVWSSRTHGWLELGFDQRLLRPRPRPHRLVGPARPAGTRRGRDRRHRGPGRAGRLTPPVPRSHCGAKKRGRVPLGTLAPFVRASCRWPRSTQ